MNDNSLTQLITFGQSFWYDNIHRAMISDGELQRMIDDDDLRGITSNPSIFEKAIATSDAYDSALAHILQTQPNLDNRAYFFSLAIEDIQAAADKLLPVYQKTQGLDGYVSLEVSPDLAHDTEASIIEAKQLHSRLNRPNVMIKIPATKAGIPVMEQLITEGININATLLFSVERYVEVAKAYINGLQARMNQGGDLQPVNSVASFFVSRVDTIIDQRLDEYAQQAKPEEQSKISQLKGQMAIANAKIAYHEYQQLFGEAFASLKAKSANPQRLLWASTGTKNPNYSDVLYLETLIGKDTVNTVPPATYQAFKDHGKAAATLATNLADAQSTVSTIGQWLDINSAMTQLETEGVAAFSKSFENLLNAIGEKVTQIKRSSAA